MLNSPDRINCCNYKTSFSRCEIKELRILKGQNAFKNKTQARISYYLAKLQGHRCQGRFGQYHFVAVTFIRSIQTQCWRDVTSEDAALQQT